jgi:hypothetical protein
VELPHEAGPPGQQLAGVAGASPRFVIVGNPENRRVLQFCVAVAASGLPAPWVVPWLEVARLGERAFEVVPQGPALLRVDSFGESFEVERALLRRGLDSGSMPRGATVLEVPEIDGLSADLGRILAPRQAHEGFLAALRDVENAAARRPEWRVLNPAWAIREMFDKAATSRCLASLEIPVPRSIPLAASARELRAALRDRGIRKAWVKLTCGSTASCLGLLSLEASGETLVTTMERAPRGFYNSRRIRRYGRIAEIERILDFILAEGAHVEEDVDKATLRDRWIDCRVVVVAGEPAFVVVRSSRYPITNLHLGGVRGDVAELEARCAPGLFAAAMASCRRVGRHYGALQVGVDLVITRGFREHFILEVNAFGDLLPRLERQGLGVYAWEVRAATRGALDMPAPAGSHLGP